MMNVMFISRRAAAEAVYEIQCNCLYRPSRQPAHYSTMCHIGPPSERVHPPVLTGSISCPTATCQIPILAMCYDRTPPPASTFCLSLSSCTSAVMNQKQCECTNMDSLEGLSRPATLITNTVLIPPPPSHSTYGTDTYTAHAQYPPPHLRTCTSSVFTPNEQARPAPQAPESQIRA